MKKIKLSTLHRIQLIDITHKIQKLIKEEKINSGIIVIYSPHTTAGITINENADPDVQKDIISFLNKTIPQDPSFHHIEGNSDAHIKGSLTNFSQTFIIENGKIQLGTWQAVYFCEFDGPRQREVWIQFNSN